MKTIKKVLCIFTCCFVIASVSEVSAAEPEPSDFADTAVDKYMALADGTEDTNPSDPDQPGTDVPDQPDVKDGWYTLEDGHKQYYAEGKFVTGFRQIADKTYYFDNQGYLLVDSWVNASGNKYRSDKKGAIIKDKLVTINSKVYYFKTNGTMLKGWKKFSKGYSYFGSNGARYTGLKKISKKWYYFNTKGIKQTGVKKVNNTTYYLDSKGVMQARKVNTKFYDANNKAMSKVKGQDFETLQRAKDILAKITTTKMTKKEKLKKCFDWVISKPYVTRRVFSNFDGWPAVYANDHFVLGGGNCMADGAAFAYLAKAIGYTKVYVCTDSKNTGAHGWAEVDGLVYDPLFAESKSYSGNYGVRYGVYRLSPILHIKI